ncbi:MAG: arginase [Planctomycetes bacterium]|nr:arginase [Planctomycetota bacterium]
MPRKSSNRTSGVAVLGVPMDLGSSLRGVDMGPSAIRIAGLHDRLGHLGLRVKDLGNVDVPHASVAGKGSPRLKYLHPIRRACRTLSSAVAAALGQGARPLVLGGDHSVAIGTLAGLAKFAQKRRKRFGLLWVDAHGDCNTARTTPSGNIHGMPLAVALGTGNRLLTTLAGHAPMIDPKRTVLFGVRDLDPGERANIRKLGLRAITMREIDEHGVYAMMQEALQTLTGGEGGGDGFHLSFDIDSLDPSYAPGVGTPVPGGLTVREAHLIMELVADTGRMVSCELVEVNPVLDRANATAKLAVDLLESAFGASIL